MKKKLANRKLANIFPEANNKTRLVMLGLATNVLEGKNRIQVAQHYVGDGEYIHAGFSKDTNTIYIRLLEE